jgi:hypothetical protein
MDIHAQARRRSPRAQIPHVDQLESRQLLSMAHHAPHRSMPAHHHQALTLHSTAALGTLIAANHEAAPTAKSGGTKLNVVAQFNNSAFNATAAIAQNDIWAVGETTATGMQQPFAVHFDGSNWVSVTVPALASGGVFSGVAAAASNDVWAVGYQNVGKTFEPLIEHWNGMSWSVASSPSPTGAALTAVTAVSSSNVWAVGSASNFSASLIEHWDGQTWSVVSAPSGSGPLYGVSADSSSDVWAVGGVTILNFNGQTWSSQTSGASSKIALHAVVALSPTNVWAVGIGPGVPHPPYSAHPSAAIEHWDGTRWSVVANPDPAIQGSNSLQAIAAVSASDIWAVGDAFNGGIGEHWNGKSWSDLVLPSGVGGLAGIAALADGTVIAVGGAGGNGIILEN